MQRTHEQVLENKRLELVHSEVENKRLELLAQQQVCTCVLLLQPSPQRRANIPCTVVDTRADCLLTACCCGV